MGRPVIKMLLGALTGVIVWMIFEPSAPKDILSSRWDVWQRDFLMAIAVSLGVVLAGYSGWAQGSRIHLIRGIILGGFLGLIATSFGSIGSYIVHGMGGDAVLSGGGNIVMRIPLRMIALTPIGTFLGAAIGAASLNWRRALQGAIGGTIGAGIGAALFDPVSSLLQSITISLQHGPVGQATEVGIFGRVLFSLLLGAGIGLFTGLVEQVAKVAWLRLTVGRNEGKEWVVDAAQTFIGRSETASVPLFGDNAIAPVHACITRQNSQYLLSDQGSQSGTFLNGYPVTHPVPLFHGAMIQVGGTMLEFLMKVGTAPQRAAEALRAQQHYSVQAPAGAGAPYGVPATPVGYGQHVPMQPQQMGMPTQVVPQMIPQSPSMPTQVVSAQPAAGSPQLVAVAGPLTGQRFPILSSFEVGREGSGIALSFDTSASRKHATFSPSPAGIFLSDLGSTNGTYVNDQRVQAASLNKGDLVRIGVTTFRVE